MTITPEQARRELARRELARRELGRREVALSPTQRSSLIPTIPDFIHSGQEYFSNTAQALLHPVQTVKGIGNIVLGTVQKAIPGTQPQEVYADAVGDFIQRRYGNVEKALETLKHDPVGTMADASMALSGGAGLVGRVGQVGKLSSLVSASRVAGRIGRAIDPLAVTSKAAGATARAISIPQQRVAGRMVNSLIKPTNRQFSYGRNPGLAVAQEGIVATNLYDLASKVAQRRQQIGGQIGQALIIPPVASKRMNLVNAIDPLTDAITKASQSPRTNATLIRRLENLRDDLLRVTVDAEGVQTVTRDLTQLTPSDVFQLKTEIGELTRWTDNLTEDTLVNAALKRSYGVVRQSLEGAVPGIKSLNTRYGNLLEAENAARRQAFAAERATKPGFMDMVALATGAGAGGAFGRSPQAALTGALLSMGARRLAESPTFRTGIAAFLQKSSPAEVASLFRRIPGLQSELARVGVLAGVGQQRVQDALPVESQVR